MIVGLAPQMDDELACNLKPFSGWDGDKLAVLTAHAGIDLEDCRLETIVRCRPPRLGREEQPPKWDEVENCREYLEASLAATQPKVVITLGEMSTAWFLGRGVKFSSVRGKRQKVTINGQELVVIPMYSPAMVEGGKNPKLVQTLINDWKRVGLKPPLRYEQLGTYVEVDQPTLNRMLAQAWDQGYRQFAFDFETDPASHDWKGTFQARRGKPVGFSLAWEFGYAVYTTADVECIRWLLEHPDARIVAHNAKFEDMVCRAAAGIYIRNLYDSKLLAYLLRRNSTELKVLSWTELGIVQTKFEEVDWDDSEAVAQYGAADSDLTLRIYNYLEAELPKSLAWLHEEVERPLLRVIANMELRGIGLDREPLDKLRVQLETRLPEIDAELASAYPYVLQKKGGYEPPNWRSPDDKATVFFGTPYWKVEAMGEGCKRITKKEFPEKERSSHDYDEFGGEERGKQVLFRRFSNIQISPPGLGYKVKGKKKTDLDMLYHLERQGGESKIPGLLIERTSITTALSKDIGKLPELAQEDGRVHSSFHQAGGWEEGGGSVKASPETGRLSSSGPNLHNITHHGDTERPYLVEWGRQIRTGIIAAPGNKLVIADVGQEEPRIGAFKSGDNKLAEDVDSGDVYLVAAAAAFGKSTTEINREERQIGKRMFMAWLNRAGADGLLRSAWWLSRQDAWNVVYQLRETYPDFERWCAQIIRQLKRDGFVTTHFGRIIYRPGIFSDDAYAVSSAMRACIPDIIQGTAADVLKMAMVRVENSVFHDILTVRGETEVWHPTLGTVSNIHDEIIVEVPAEVVLPTAKVCLAMTDGLLPITLPVEVTFGDNWAEKKEVPGLEEENS